jgi:hypothetical protein
MRKNDVLNSLCWSILGIAAFYFLAALALWFIYSMREMVSGGTYTQIQAESLVLRMALVTTGLTLVGILCIRRFVGRASSGKLAVASSLATGFMLTLYTGLNVLWRNVWHFRVRERSISASVERIKLQIFL